MDTAEFDRIYHQYNPRLFSFLLRMARNRATAEDLLEETWLRLVSSRGAPAEECMGAWLFTVARNLFVSHCRSCAREQSYMQDLVSLWPVSPRSPYDLAALGEFEDRLEEALAEIPPMYREVLLLNGVEGLRAAEVAAICGIRPETARQRLSRARSMLAEKMEAKV